MNQQTRNPQAGIHAPAAQHAAAPALASQPAGVGGRHLAPPPAPRGGGYLPVCNASGAPVTARAAAATDCRIAKLREMGVHPIWIIVAARIGWDAFVLQWEVFSANADMLDGRNRITIPSIDTYRRYQRNEAIRSLFREGRTPEEVSEIVSASHGNAPKLERLRRMRRNMAA